MPVIIDVHRHIFEIYTLVLEIHKNVDLVLGIKNVFELEGVINLRDCCFKFFNRSLPIFTMDHVILKTQGTVVNKSNSSVVFCRTLYDDKCLMHF